MDETWAGPLTRLVNESGGNPFLLSAFSAHSAVNNCDLLISEEDYGSMWQDLRPLTMLSTVVYSVIGWAIFGLAFLLMLKISPFFYSQRDLNRTKMWSLAIIMGSVFISLAMIIQAAMR